MEKNINVVITNYYDDHEQDHFIMSEIAFTAISWFLDTYGLTGDYRIEKVADFEPKVLPF